MRVQPNTPVRAGRRRMVGAWFGHGWGLVGAWLGLSCGLVGAWLGPGWGLVEVWLKPRWSAVTSQRPCAERVFTCRLVSQA